VQGLVQKSSYVDSDVGAVWESAVVNNQKQSHAKDVFVDNQKDILSPGGTRHAYPHQFSQRYPNTRNLHVFEDSYIKD
jgi:hypothetical protein